MTANDIIELLRSRHSDDLFLTEVTIGSVFIGKKTRRIDALAMKPSWTDRGAVTAYEVKVSRSDFMGDDKWREYLNSCESFYFVAPEGIINTNELPNEAGLIEVSKNCKRLYSRKRATIRPGAVSEETWRRIVMMLRFKEPSHAPKPVFEDWRAYLDKKDEQSAVGRKIASYTRQQVSRALSEEQDKLSAERRSVANARFFMENMSRHGFLDANGLPTDKYHAAVQLAHNEKAAIRIDKRILRDVRRAAESLIQHLPEDG